MSPRVTFISQFNDPTTTQDGQNCTATAFCMLLELAAQKRMWPGDFRKLQSDNEGGISIPDGARAWHRATTADLDYAAPLDGTSPPNRRGNGITEEQAWALLGQGVGIVWQGLYSAWNHSLQPGFNDGHAMYVDGRRVSTVTKRRQAYVMDPLGKYADGYHGEWVPFSDLVRYGIALGVGDTIYAAWASPALPDTGTEPDVNFKWIDGKPDSGPGTVTVQGNGHSAILQNGTLLPLPAGAQKHSYGRVQFIDGPRPNEFAYAIGENSAFLLTADVTYVAAVPDAKHFVAIAVDGVINKASEVLV